MNTNHQHNEPIDLRNAVGRVALGLDSLLLNGIQYGVLASIAPDMPRKLGETLIHDLDELVNVVQAQPGIDANVALKTLADLRITIEEMIQTVARLAPLEAKSEEDVRHASTRIVGLRDACVSMVEKIEDQLHVSERWHRSRPKDATELMNRFLANLASALEESRQSSKREKSRLPA